MPEKQSNTTPPEQPALISTDNNAHEKEEYKKMVKESKLRIFQIEADIRACEGLLKHVFPQGKPLVGAGSYNKTKEYIGHLQDNVAHEQNNLLIWKEGHYDLSVSE